jgi:lipopolysaccharide transport system ATP-binding protein
MDGTIKEAVEAYLQTLEQAGSQELSKRTDRKGLGQSKLVAAEVTSVGSGSSSILKTGHPVRFSFWVDALLPGITCSFTIYDSIGQPVTSFKSRVRGPEDTYASDNSTKFLCDLDELMLLPGRYRINVAIVGDKRLQDSVEAAAVFDVEEGHIRGRLAQPDGKASVCMAHRWTLPTKT